MEGLLGWKWKYASVSVWGFTVYAKFIKTGLDGVIYIYIYIYA